jgi:hypothetical protein
VGRAEARSDMAMAATPVRGRAEAERFISPAVSLRLTAGYWLASRWEAFAHWRSDHLSCMVECFLELTPEG